MLDKETAEQQLGAWLEEARLEAAAEPLDNDPIVHGEPLR